MKRIVIYLNEDNEISYDCDDGVEVEVVNYQAIERNDPFQGGEWTVEDVEDFAKWGKGLVPDHVIEGLKYSIENRDNP